MRSEIKHHLPQDVMAAYSAGTLAEAYSLVVATHVSLCDQCRAELASLDALGGALIEDVEEVAISDTALAATMALIEMGNEKAAAAPAPKPVQGGVFPAPLADYVGGGPDAVNWRSMGGGIKQALIPTGEGGKARLLYIPAGSKVPDHGHDGLELTLVLQGAFKDHVSRFGRGDVEVGDDDLEHVPVAEEGEDCICLAATDAPLKFKALVPRMMQSILRI